MRVRHPGRSGVEFPPTRRRIRVESIVHDVRFALRTLRRRPVFALVAVATLGIGIGTITAMFAVVENVIYQSVPFARPDRLVNVWLSSEEAKGAPGLIGESWSRIPISSR